MKKIFIMLILLVFVSCSTSTSEVVDADDLDNQDVDIDSVDVEDLEDNQDVEDTDETDDLSDEVLTDLEASDDDTVPEEFLGDFDMTGKTCVTDIPQGRIMLTTARDYSDSELAWRVYVHVLKDDGSIVDTEKYFETDPDLRGIGFNSNGRLAALSSWQTGHVTLFALVERTLCIAQTGIKLPNLKDRGDSTERVIFGEVTANPNDPYRFFLTYSNPLETSDYSNYSGGIYTMTVDSSGHAEISEEHPEMHVPGAFTILPGGKKAIVKGGKEFIIPQDDSVGSAGPDDIAILNIEGDTPTVIKWFDLWGTPGENGSGISLKTMGVSGDKIMMANSGEYSEEPGVIKLFSYDGNETLTQITTFTDDSMEDPDYIAMSNDGQTAVVINSFFKGATLAIGEEDVTYVKQETHDLTEPMIKLKGEPFEDHVVIHSFRSSNDESSSITIAKIASEGLEEKSLTALELIDDFSAQNIAVQ